MPSRVFGTTRQALIQAAEAMEDDLYRLGDERATSRAYLEEVLGSSMTVESFHDYTQDLGVRSRAVVYRGPEWFIDRGPVDADQLKTDFGRTLMASRSLPNLGTAAVMESQCVETEPRLFRSLTLTADRLEAGELETPRGKILTQNGQPIGYEKSSGQAVVYFWDQTVLNTYNGPRTIAADSFGFIGTSISTFFKLQAETDSLVALEVNPETVNDAGTLRTSTRSYPRAMRVAMAHAAAEMSPTLRPHIDQAINLDPQDVAQKVGALMLDRRIKPVS